MAACKLCFNNFTTRFPERIPRLLDCKHSFCTECLSKLKDLQGAVVQCPSCLYVTTIPCKGVDYLDKDETTLSQQINIKSCKKCKHCSHSTYPTKNATLYCNNCDDYFCGVCSDNVHMKIGNQDHAVRLAYSHESRISTNSSASSVKSIPQLRVFEERKKNGVSSFDELFTVVDNEEKLRCYSCNSNIRTSVSREDEVEERDSFMQNTQKFDDAIENYCNTRLSVLKTIDNLQDNFKKANDKIRQHYRELRSILDETEKSLTEKLHEICEKRLYCLKDQNTKMTELAADAKVLSDKCARASKCEIHELLLRRGQLEVSMEKSIELLANCHPAFKDDLYVQYPEKEKLIHAIKTFPFIVQVSEPPSNLHCKLSADGDIILKWDLPSNLRFTYRPSLFTVYASVGDKTDFVLLERVHRTECALSQSHSKLRGAKVVRFQVACVNIVGESCPTFPVSFRIPTSRKE